MRSALLGAIVLLAACTASGGDEGTPRATAQRTFDVGAFDRVNMAGSYDAVITVGGAPSVRAEGDAEALERLEIRVEDGELRIASRGRGGWSWIGHAHGVTVHISAPTLIAASVAGSGDIRIDRVEGPEFAASVAGSGDLAVAALRVERAAFSVGGSGNVRAAGSVGEARVSIAGSGNVDLSRVASRAADIQVMGSGDARVSASETASVMLMGSGDVTVTGGARCSIEKRGSGDVNCG